MFGVIPWLLALELAAPSEPAVQEMSLHWSVPPQCPEASVVRTRIDALADGAEDPVAVDVTVTRDESSFIADVTVSSSEGRTRKRLTSASCDEIAETVAVIVAVHRPASGLEPADPEPTDEPPGLVPIAETATEQTTPVRAAVAPVAPTPTVSASTDQRRTASDSPPPKPGRGLRGAAWIEGSVAMGSLPLGARLGGGVGLLGRRFRAELAGRYWLPRDPESAEPRARVALTSVTVRAGPVFTFGPVELLMRAVVEAGVARGVGRGVDVSNRSLRPWVAAGVAPALLWPVRPRFALGLTGELLGVALRPRFEVKGAGTVFVAGAIAGGAGLTAEIRFP